MNRSSSELCFQKFLQGAEGLPMSGQENQVAECIGVVQVEVSQPSDQTPAADVDPGEYAVVLKKKLDMYCAAVAKSMGSKDAPQLGLQTSSNGDVANIGIAHLVTLNPGVGSKPSNSCSSKELSDENEEDLEGDNDMTDDINPANAKRMRRMLSNRESARRSRKRKQEHVNELETEVLQLRVENSSLSRRLTDMTQKYNDASVDNRVLKADVETLRAKVKMAEDKVKGETWLDDEIYRSISGISTVTVPFSLGPPVEISEVEVQSKGIECFFREPDSDCICPSDVIVSRTDSKCQSLKRVASLEFLQRRMSGGSSSCDLNQCDAAMRDDNEAPDKPN